MVLVDVVKALPAEDDIVAGIDNPDADIFDADRDDNVEEVEVGEADKENKHNDEDDNDDEEEEDDNIDVDVFL